jgi:hypothetical protein
MKKLFTAIIAFALVYSWGVQAGALGIVTDGLQTDADVVGTGVADIDVVDVSHDPTDITDRMRPDIDVVDTVLAFTNLVGAANSATCVARNEYGNQVGRARTKMRGHGIGFILLSDMTQSVDVIASVNCKSARHLVASAILVGSGEVENLPVIQTSPGAHILIPIAAHY